MFNKWTIYHYYRIFKQTIFSGQKAYHYPWNTYADEVRVEFESDGEIGGSGFEISFSEAERQFECSNRKDCTHIGLNQHICDFDKVTNDKVCKKAKVTIIIFNHCSQDKSIFFSFWTNFLKWSILVQPLVLNWTNNFFSWFTENLDQIT